LLVNDMNTHETSYLDYYNLERYLFDVVSARFEAAGSLSAFDFFCIVIWKANRAKSRVAKRLLSKGEYTSLGDAVGALTRQLAQASSAEARFLQLVDAWGFRLPMASAILSILFPSEFTVYDVRVCNELREFHSLQDLAKPARQWKGYQRYMAAVDLATPPGLSLRDKDRWLWGKSFATQLESDLLAGFT